jgi:hypothetical protein
LKLRVARAVISLDVDDQRVIEFPQVRELLDDTNRHNPNGFYFTIARSPLRRQRVLPELRVTDHHNAGPRAWRIPAFKCGGAGAGFSRLDGGKAPTKNGVVLIGRRMQTIGGRCS